MTFKTPSQDEIEKRLLKQDQMGADILKIAVMPKSKQDVFTLMNATLKVSQQTTKPLLTMSMGQLGTISVLRLPIWAEVIALA